MSAQLTDLCRLCLEQNPDFSVHEDKISTKIAELLSVEIDPDAPEFPTKICRTCRVSLERLYIFRMRSLETDSKLRTLIYGKESLTDRISTSINFLKQYDTEFYEHDYGERSTLTKEPVKQLNPNDISEEEYSSIEHTVQQALNQNNYFGQFVLKIEEIDTSGLRKVRVIKDNGANIIMKIRMPESKKKVPNPPKTDDSFKKILEKCENIENNQEKITRCVLRTEKTVGHINTIVQNFKKSDGVEFVSIIETQEPQKDDNAPFELPINSLSELWRLNSRIIDTEVRDAMNIEMLRLEPQPGMKIIGRVVRSIIDKDLLGQICWSGRVKVDHKYMKTDDRIMLSKMKNIVDYMLEVCRSKEETSNHVFLQTLMNMIRKARFKFKDTSYEELSAFKEEYLNDEDYAEDTVEVGEILG